jgi:hypothetical protein
MSASPVTIFSCRRRRDAGDCTEPGCLTAPVASCAFVLRGKKAGELCGRKICGPHGGAGEPPCCGPHQRVSAKQ